MNIGKRCDRFQKLYNNNNNNNNNNDKKKKKIK